LAAVEYQRFRRHAAFGQIPGSAFQDMHGWEPFFIPIKARHS
jgi:hypothetical protein